LSYFLLLLSHFLPACVTLAHRAGVTGANGEQVHEVTLQGDEGVMSEVGLGATQLLATAGQGGERPTIAHDTTLVTYGRAVECTMMHSMYISYKPFPLAGGTAKEPPTSSNPELDGPDNL
jgi:hypothetical protein